MIYDSLKGFARYCPVHPLLTVISDYLDSHPLQDAEAGRHDLGRGIYYLVSEYDTKSPQQGILEAHRRYIDIQIVLDGVEKIGVCPVEACSEITPYCAERDFLTLGGTPDFLTLKNGLFALLFPADAHMPGIQTAANSCRVRKVVFKVPVL